MLDTTTVASFFAPSQPLHGRLKQLGWQQTLPGSGLSTPRTISSAGSPSAGDRRPHFAPTSVEWKPNKFVQQYIIPKDSIFNRPLKGDASKLVHNALSRHEKLVRAVRPHKQPLQISAIEMEAKKILRGRNQEIAVTSGSFAKAIMDKMRDQQKIRAAINGSLTSINGSNGALNRASATSGHHPVPGKGGVLPGTLPGDRAHGSNHRHRNRNEQSAITEDAQPERDASPVMKQFRKVARVTPMFQRTHLPMAERFRRAAKAVCKAVRNSKIDGRIGLRDVLKLQHGRDEDLELMSSESHILSLDAMEIWYKETYERSSADLDYLERGISLLKCFNKYSPSVRRELCRAAKFESFQQGRMLIKQGHEPISMYFLISGTVEVVKSETDAKTGKVYTQTVAVLHPGDGFGDVALMNKTKRTASAVCRTDVKLLRIDGEDYQEVVKMAVEQELLGKWEFLRCLNVFYDMEEMPELKRLAEIGVLKEYQQNSIIHKDIVNSDDLYFIRKVFQSLKE